MILPEDRVVVVGAGVGGLVSALLLAARGFAVTVVDRAPGPGGKLGVRMVDGRAIDAGPSVFTMRWVFDELFAEAGDDFAARITLNPAGILARHAWTGKDRLDLFADAERSRDAIAAFSGPGDARGFDNFREEARGIYETLEAPFLRNAATNPLGLTARIGFGEMAALRAMRPMERMWRALGRHFGDPRLRQLFGHYATRAGSVPWRAPATMMLIAHIEQSGVWLVEGGMHRIAQALEAAAIERGVVFRYGTDCRGIDISSHGVEGIRLASGEYLEAGAVVCNADPAALADGWFGEAASHAAAPIERSERSLSAVTWLLSAETAGFPLLHQNVFFSRNYAGEFRTILSDQRLPEDPTIHICAQDRDAADGATLTGPERLQLLVHAPPIGDIRDFSAAEIRACESRMMRRLAACGLSIAQRPEATIVTTPAGFDRLYPATGGALYGRAAHGWASAFRRPGARTRIPGLYLAGGGAHPGAGIPMAALSARQAVASLIADRATRGRSIHRMAAG